MLYLKYVTRGLGLLIEQLLLLHGTWNQENVRQAFSLVRVTSETVFHMQNSMCSGGVFLFYCACVEIIMLCMCVCVYVCVCICVCACMCVRVCVSARTFLTCMTMGSLENEYLAWCIHCMVRLLCVCVCVCV